MVFLRLHLSWAHTHTHPHARILLLLFSEDLLFHHGKRKRDLPAPGNRTSSPQSEVGYEVDIMSQSPKLNGDPSRLPCNMAKRHGIPCVLVITSSLYKHWREKSTSDSSDSDLPVRQVNRAPKVPHSLYLPWSQSRQLAQRDTMTVSPTSLDTGENECEAKLRSSSARASVWEIKGSGSFHLATWKTFLCP